MAMGRYFRMHMIGYSRGSTARRHCVALCGLVLAARDPAAFELRQDSRSFVAVAHAFASASRGAREGVRVRAEAGRRARPVEGRADRRRRLDDGSQCGAAHDRAARQRRELPRDADADGERGGIHTPSAEDLAKLRPQAQGQDAVERGLDEPAPPRGEDRLDERRNGASGLQARARVDPDTSVVVAAPIHLADPGGTTTQFPTLEAAASNLAEVGLAPSQD